MTPRSSRSPWRHDAAHHPGQVVQRRERQAARQAALARPAWHQQVRRARGLPAAARDGPRRPSSRRRGGEVGMEPEEIGLPNLQPAEGSRRDRKRSGRGHGSGHGKTSGRGHKGYGSRSGAKQRTRFEGGQNPLHMRMRKLRGRNKKMSMPFEPFRTHTQPVNLEDLEARFDAGAEVTPETLRAAGLATKRDVPVKVLGRGELSKQLTVSAHGFSKSARAAIENAGGTCTLIER